MVSWKKVAKVINGLSLVAGEGVRHLKSSGGLQSLILKAADVAALTKGNPRRIDTSRHHCQFEDTTDSDAQTNKVRVDYLAEDDEPSLPQPLRTDSTSGPQSLTADFTLKDDNSGNVSAPPYLRKQRKPKERRVPSTPFSRALGFAGLGAGLAWGTLQESAKRIAFGTPNMQNSQHTFSPFLSEKNAERLALALCRMRGAALKLGQMLSIQDESLVPAPILAALDTVRQGADMMPRNQLNQVLKAELGSDWESKLTSFDYEPMAAASIGQVMQFSYIIPLLVNS